MARKQTEWDNQDVAARVLRLYGKPRLETWKKIGRRLRIPRGSAWSLAHGLRKPDKITVEYLGLVEWGINCLPGATGNLSRMIGWAES